MNIFRRTYSRGRYTTSQPKQKNQSLHAVQPSWLRLPKLNGIFLFFFVVVAIVRGGKSASEREKREKCVHISYRSVREKSKAQRLQFQHAFLLFLLLLQLSLTSLTDPRRHLLISPTDGYSLVYTYLPSKYTDTKRIPRQPSQKTGADGPKDFNGLFQSHTRREEDFFLFNFSPRQRCCTTVLIVKGR